MALCLNNSREFVAFTHVLQGLASLSLTRAVIMDHLDWLSPGSKDIDDRVDQFYQVLSPGGFVRLRSRATKPWHCDVFERQGFTVTALGVRKELEVPLNCVNMYVCIILVGGEDDLAL
ncbi:hypothetical protein EDB19DRAFT_1916243 [Suillus lakei]|nr:hypothetical protein EDB19DRAFT_1916243 [Suillus lakei]